jgi:hypothetical protein
VSLLDSESDVIASADAVVDAPERTVVGSVDAGNDNDDSEDVGNSREEAGTEESAGAVGFCIIGDDGGDDDSTTNWAGAVAVAGGVEAMGC